MLPFSCAQEVTELVIPFVIRFKWLFLKSNGNGHEGRSADGPLLNYWEKKSPSWLITELSSVQREAHLVSGIEVPR